MCVCVCVLSLLSSIHFFVSFSSVWWRFPSFFFFCVCVFRKKSRESGEGGERRGTAKMRSFQLWRDARGEQVYCLHIFLISTASACIGMACLLADVQSCSVSLRVSSSLFLVISSPINFTLSIDPCALLLTSPPPPCRGISDQHGSSLYSIS
jgi:hypothetical protein